MPRTIAIVEWTDASWDSATVTPDEIEPLAVLSEAGWLVREDRDSITLALELCEADGTCRHTVSIPRVGIRKLRKIRTGKRGNR